MAHHPDGGFQFRPLPLGVQIVQAVRLGDDPAFPPFHPPVSLVQGLSVVIGHAVKAQCLGPFEQVLNILVQLTLVLLHRQHIVGTTICDLLRNLSLAAHGVDSYDTAIQLQHLQQLRNGSDLIGFLVGLDLTQGQALLGGPGADHMDGPLLPSTVIGPSGRLAVDSHHLARQQLGDGLGP